MFKSLRRDTEICNAYAEAAGTGAHMNPGHLNLVWHVWETSRGRHLTDPAVRSCFGEKKSR